MTIDNEINDYKEWVNKEIPINSDWIDEINYISHVREEIHEKKDRLTPKQLNEVKKLDQKLQSWISGNTARGFVYTDKPKDFIGSQMWWWQLDKLESLSLEEKSQL